MRDSRQRPDTPAPHPGQLPAILERAAAMADDPRVRAWLRRLLAGEGAEQATARQGGGA
jgi:hypothetical protein